MEFELGAARAYSERGEQNQMENRWKMKWKLRLHGRLYWIIFPIEDSLLGNIIGLYSSTKVTPMSTLHGALVPLILILSVGSTKNLLLVVNRERKPLSSFSA